MRWEKQYKFAGVVSAPSHREGKSDGKYVT